MRYHPLTSPQPIIYLTVDDSAPLPFLLDTGLNQGVVFTQDTVAKLHLKVGDGTRYLFPDPKPYREVKVGKFNIVGGAHQIVVRPLRGVYVTPQDKEYAGYEQVAGTVGALFLEPFVVQFDFKEQKLRLRIGKDYQPPMGEDIQVLPLMPLDSIRPIIKAEFAKEESGAFLLDTGSSNTLLIERFATKLLKKTVAGISSSVAATQPTKVGLLEHLMIGSLTIKNILAAQYPHSVTDDAATKKRPANEELLLNQSLNIIGNDVLDQFLLTVDISHNRVVLEPREKGKALSARIIGQPQARLSMNTRGYVVTEIRKDISLFKVGDVIDSVDGVKLKTLTLNQAQRVLDGIAETFAHITIRRGLDKLTVDYQRRSPVPTL